MSARLLCRVRTGLTLSFELLEKESVLGREPGLAVALPVEGVSRRHARVIWDGKSHWVEDLRSTNGTFLNGQAVAREKLRHLDVITLGPEADLVFLSRPADAAAVPILAIVRAALVAQGGDSASYDIAPGEITLGRSPSCNVAVEGGDVSKVHARIERTRDQLVLEDLGSANGTFVNGARVATIFLKPGDLLTLAGAQSFRVELEMGEVGSASGRHSATLAREAGEHRQRFSADWKTRMLLSEEEWGRLVEMRKRLDEDDRRRAESRGSTLKPPAAPAPKASARSTPAGPPAAALPKVEPPAKAAPPVPVPKIEAPSVAKPVPPVVKAPPVAAAPPPPAPARPVPPAPPLPASPPPPPAPARPPLPAPAVPAAPVARAQPVPVAARPPAEPVNPAASAVVREIRLRADGIDLVVSAPGEHELGRAAESPLRVNHPTVSRRQACVILSGDRTMVYLQHVGGTNRTQLNGRLVEKLSPLSDGDVVRVGEVELRVTITRG